MEGLQIAQGLLLFFTRLMSPLAGAIEIALLLLLFLQSVIGAEPLEGSAAAIERHHQISRRA